ncbi:hypothetical protein [Photobacterium proteolyticum]|nr:hypothetical protein [Photobacterium proteolyticum]
MKRFLMSGQGIFSGLPAEKDKASQLTVDSLTAKNHALDNQLQGLVPRSVSFSVTRKLENDSRSLRNMAATHPATRCRSEGSQTQPSEVCHLWQLFSPQK